MSLTREDLVRFAARPRTVTTIEVPDLGPVGILLMNGAERERLESALHQAVKADAATIRALFAIALACDPDGKPLFTAADLDLVNSLPWTVVDAIKEAGERLNALTPEANRELAKN